MFYPESKKVWIEHVVKPDGFIREIVKTPTIRISSVMNSPPYLRMRVFLNSMTVTL